MKRESRRISYSHDEIIKQIQKDISEINKNLTNHVTETDSKIVDLRNDIINLRNDMNKGFSDLRIELKDGMNKGFSGLSKDIASIRQSVQSHGKAEERGLEEDS